MPTWPLDLGIDSKVREAALTATTSLEATLSRIRGRANPPPAQKKLGRRAGLFEGAYRAVWTITPRDRDALDFFFNGITGYRAAYSRSIDCGEETNAAALAFLSSWLRDFNGTPVDRASVPLLGTGAKLWISEDARINQALITGDVTRPEVLVPAWLEAAQKRIAVQRGKELRYKAAAGILAPRPETLKVIGAWIRDGTIVEQSAKNRSEEIRSFGYT